VHHARTNARTREGTPAMTDNRSTTASSLELRAMAQRAAVDPRDCIGCVCPCHGDDADPGPHIASCAWADPTFPEYLDDE